MFKQFRQRSTPTSRVPDVLVVFAVLFFLLGMFAGCKKDPIHPNEKCNTKMAPGPTQLLVSELQGGAGSTIGPDGDLYVTEAAAGKVSRIDPKTGNVTKEILNPLGNKISAGDLCVLFTLGKRYELLLS